MELLSEVKLSDNEKYQHLNNIINKDTRLVDLKDIYIYYIVELLQKYGHKFYKKKKIPTVFKILIEKNVLNFIFHNNENRFGLILDKYNSFPDSDLISLQKDNLNNYTIVDNLDFFSSKTKYIVSFFIIVFILLFVFLKKNVFENFSGGKNIYKNDYKKLKKYSLTKFLYN